MMGSPQAGETGTLATVSPWDGPVATAVYDPKCPPPVERADDFHYRLVGPRASISETSMRRSEAESSVMSKIGRRSLCDSGPLRMQAARSIFSEGLTAEPKTEAKAHRAKPQKTPAPGGSVDCLEYRKSCQRANLINHRGRQAGTKRYRCPQCGNGFANGAVLKRHMRIHTGEKPYQCSQCEKGFIQAHQLMLHQRTHTGEKPFSCQVCGKNFSRKDNMLRHRRTHIL